jgi:fructokinase
MFMCDVIAFGELLIDFTPHDLSKEGNFLFQRNAGGGVANASVAIAKLGKTTAFIGKVGGDEFGVFLKDTLEENGVDATGLKFSKNVNTTLAFVQLDKTGERKFSFYRNPGADTTLLEEEIDYDMIYKSKAFHFSSLLLTDEPSRSSTLAALKAAKEGGLLISYDPNLRPSLWKSLEEARQQIISVLSFANILKISEEELEFITGSSDIYEGIELLVKYNISVVFVTLGAKGCIYSYKGGIGSIEAYNVHAIDATGAGDGFLGGILFKLCNKTLIEIENMDKKEFEYVVQFGNAVGALVTTKKGGIPSMPTLEEVENFMRVENVNKDNIS